MIPEFPENDFDDGENKEALVSFKQSVMAHQEPSFPSDPGECALHHKAPFVSRRPLVFIFGKNLLFLFAEYSFGNAGSGSMLFKVLAKGLAVISPVRDDFSKNFSGSAPASIGNGNIGQDPGSEFNLGDIGGFNDMGYRDAISVDGNLPFGSLAFLGVANTRAPLLAGAKLASIMP